MRSRREQRPETLAPASCSCRLAVACFFEGPGPSAPTVPFKARGPFGDLGLATADVQGLLSTCRFCNFPSAGQFSAYGTCPVKLPSDVLDNAGDWGGLTTPTACTPGPQSACYLLKLHASLQGDLVQVLPKIHHLVILRRLHKLIFHAL